MNPQSEEKSGDGRNLQTIREAVDASTEMDQLRYWILASSHDSQRWLEGELWHTPHEVGTVEAAHQLSRLDALLQLTKSRYDTTLSLGARRTIIYECNRLLKGGIATQIANSIRRGVEDLKLPAKSLFADRALRKLAECMFYSFYETQIESAELRELTDVIQHLSATLVEFSSPDVVEDWKTSAYAVLVILQMTQVCSLDQFNELQRRAVDEPPGVPGGVEFSDINDLRPASGSRDGMDLAWRSKGAKGLACLAHAVLRQPAVDAGEAPATDVVWLLIEASNLRAYSYIRLCVLPVLQSLHLRDEDNFYISVLCELLRKIAHIFHIYELALHPDRPLFLRSHDLAVARSGSTSIDSPPLIPNDCLDDVMHLYAAVCRLRPAFAEAFREVDEQGSSSLHPFVGTSIDASDRQPCLILPCMRILAGVGSGPNGSTAAATYQFLRGGKHPRLKWDHFFFCMESYARQMGSAVVTQYPTGVSGIYLPAPAAQPSYMSTSTSSVPGGAVRAAPLSTKDEEGLIAMMDLIAVCASGASIADSLYARYDPVKRLFALLACPVPVALKGTIFRALSSLARSSAAAAVEIWDMIEVYRLLPAKGVSVASSGGGAGGLGPGLAQHGLRFELEATESRAGVYPATEGFLELLDALISTHGPPDELGLGYRRPGIMVYLEFVIDDVLLRAHERYYAPEDRRGAAQRWRLSARALKVLVSVVQHYGINRLPENVPLHALPSVIKDDDSLQRIAADFREDSVLYNIDGMPDQRCSRPKTAGFVTMSLVLGRGRLMERVLSHLAECSVPVLQESRLVEGTDSARRAVEILGTMQEPVPIRGGVLATTGGVGMGMGAFGQPGGQGQNQVMEVEIDLSAIGFNEDLGTCDEAFWREKTASTAMGLLYECSLREARFLALLRSAPPLTVMRSEDGRPTAVPVMLQGSGGGLAEILSNNLALGTIAHFLRLPLSACHSVPPMPVMSARLLEHVASNQPAQRSLWSIRYTVEQEQYLLHGCVRALIEGDGAQSSLIFKEIVALGADRAPDVFSQSLAASTGAPDSAAALRAAISGGLSCEDTVRGAVLSFLLKTLVADRLCLSHQLLGVRDAIEEASRNADRGDRTAAAPSLPKMAPAGRTPLNCLQAILVLMAPAATVGELGTPGAAGPRRSFLSLIQRDPDLALMCFELLYRLCAAPLTSAITLAFLRRHSVDFLRQQMREMQYLATLPDSLLAADTAGSSMASSEAAAVGGQLSSRLDRIKAARHHCTAWVLQIYALELRMLETASNTSPTQLLDTLGMLFESAASEGGAGASGGMGPMFTGSQATLAPVCALQRTVFDLPQLDLQSIASPIVLRSLTAATSPYSVGRGGKGGSSAPDGTKYGFSTVDIAMFTKLVRDEVAGLAAIGRSGGALSEADFDDGVRAAVVMNVYNRRAAAATHLCQAWSQAVDVAAIGCGGLLYEGRGEGRSAALRRLINTVVIPTLRAIATSSRLEMVMAEQLVRPLLSIICQLRTPSSLGGPFTHVLTGDEHQELLHWLVQCLLHRGGAQREGPRSATSSFFRGFIGACITRVLHLSLSIPTSTSSARPQRRGQAQRNGNGDGGSWTPSEEDKEAEGDLAGFGYQRAGELAVGIASVEECRERDLVVLERFASELVDVLGVDATNGPAVWRVNALAALSAVLTSLSPARADELASSPSPSSPRMGDNKYASRFRDLHASPVLGKTLQTLLQRGHLLGILSYVGPAYLYTADAAAVGGFDPSLKEPGSQELFESAVALCVALATSQEGVAALLDGEFIQRVCALQFLRNPPPAVEELLPFGKEGAVVREEAVRLFDARLSPTLRVLRCMASLAPSSTVLEGAAEFLRLNHASVTYLLRLRVQTLRGLAMVESVLSLMAAVAAAPPVSASAVARQKQARFGSNTPTSSADVGTVIWDSVLEEKGDAFTADICTIVKLLGGEPLPVQAASRYRPPANRGGGRESGPSSWWSHFLPSTPQEELQHQTPCIDGAALGMSPDWSVFEQRKLVLSLRITSIASTFLRLRTASCVELGLGGSRHSFAGANASALTPHSFASTGGLLAIDFDAVVRAVESCASLYQQRATARGSYGEESTSMKWLTSTSTVTGSPVDGRDGSYTTQASGDIEAWLLLPALLGVVENLICVLHDLNVTASPAEATSWAPELDRCTSTAESFSPHSFVRQVARRIRDQMSNS